MEQVRGGVVVRNLLPTASVDSRFNAFADFQSTFREGADVRDDSFKRRLAVRYGKRAERSRIAYLSTHLRVEGGAVKYDQRFRSSLDGVDKLISNNNPKHFAIFGMSFVVANKGGLSLFLGKRLKKVRTGNLVGGLVSAS